MSITPNQLDQLYKRVRQSRMKELFEEPCALYDDDDDWWWSCRLKYDFDEEEQ